MLGSHIRALLLDLDETLLDDDRGMHEAVRRTTSQLVQEVSDIDAELLTRVYVEESRSFYSATGLPTVGSGADGITARTAQWRSALDRCAIHDDAIVERTVALYAAARHDTYQLFPDVLPFLEATAGRYSVAIVTNGAADIQREKIVVTGLDRHIATIVVSGEIGFWKPEPAIFEGALRRLNVPASAASHVGDSYASDVVGARAAGVMPVWLVRSEASSTVGDGEPLLTIRSLAELLDE